MCNNADKKVRVPNDAISRPGVDRNTPQEKLVRNTCRVLFQNCLSGRFCRKLYSLPLVYIKCLLVYEVTSDDVLLVGPLYWTQGYILANVL